MDIKNIVNEQFKKSVGKKEISFKTDINDMTLSSYLFIKENTDKLFVILNGALDRSRTGCLTYHRYSWHSLFDGSVLYIADPTLFKYESLSLSWYMGDKYTSIYPYLEKLVLNVAQNLNISSSKTIIYGSSGGGFSALQLASYLGNDTLAVCINPQTNILKYVETARDNFLAQCFSASIYDRSTLTNNHRFNAIKNIKICNTKVLYVQNETDVFHVKNHFNPLIRELDITDWTKTFTVDKSNKSRIQVLWYVHESGHAAEPKESLPEILKAVDYMIEKVR
ncbi:hypothetical protein A1D22_08900 [Pasteurellaceae bacterium LFhippo2]|nr:hypothetical protein [Pasteurellaceae bacterium LFhippo2]